MKTVSSILLVGALCLCAMAVPALAAEKSDQIRIRYVPPTLPEHQTIFQEMKRREVLEKLKILLSPFRLYRKLEISLEECDGEADAFYDYGDVSITICYEFIAELMDQMPKEAPPLGIVPLDTVIGTLFDVSLHEVAHALFDLIGIPVLGREEDAADQVAAYIMLRFEPAVSRRLIAGAVYAYNVEEKKTAGGRQLEDYAGEHGTPAQRAFNLMCIAYGSDKKLFSEIANHGYLPMSRAEYCDEEYEQVQYAFETLIRPHIDAKRLEQIRDAAWLCGSRENYETGKCMLQPLP